MARVVKVARKGFDVKTAGDENLLYSSQWPVLSIYKEIPINITNPNVTAYFDHDLGYPPMFWDFANYTNTTVLDGGYNFFTNLFSVNEKHLIYTPLFPFPTGTIKGTVYLFTLDLSTAYTAPVVSVGGVDGNLRSTRSFKLAKENKSVYSNQLKDFVISTDARSPLIHSVTPGKVSGLEFRVEHNLGYIPLYFGYTKSNGYYSLLGTGGGGASRFSSSTTAVNFTESSDGREMTIVIMKDPFEAKEVAVVSV